MHNEMTNPDCFMPFGQASSSSISSGFWSQSTIFEGPELQTIPGGTPAFSTPFEQYDLLMQVQPWSLHANFLYPMALASSSSRNNRPTQPISQKSDHPEPAVDGSSLIKCPDCVATFKRIQEWKRHARCVLFAHIANNSHPRIHSKDNIQCKDCNRKFTRKDALARHVKNQVCARRKWSQNSYTNEINQPL